MQLAVEGGEVIYVKLEIDYLLGLSHAMSEKVSITLSRAEALVLFEFLSRFGEQQQLDIRDQAEQRVLWDILADLESALPEPLAHDYDQQLKRARESIRDTTA